MVHLLLVGFVVSLRAGGAGRRDRGRRRRLGEVDAPLERRHQARVVEGVVVAVAADRLVAQLGDEVLLGAPLGQPGARVPVRAGAVGGGAGRGPCGRVRGLS
ncbi:hypothetical protein, partial [Streptomyces sudanensis]|uniref:hypothetical protein n=1 Tax=Streptomyces sudanensis TaxID=436397 RepID=UPI003B833A1A